MEIVVSPNHLFLLLLLLTLMHFFLFNLFIRQIIDQTFDKRPITSSTTIHIVQYGKTP